MLGSRREGNPMRHLLTLPLAALVLTMIAPLVHAAAGDLDTGFGQAGVAYVTLGPSYDRVAAVAVQPDGRIVVAGTSGGSPNYDSAFAFTLLRYHADGTLDASFGDGGKVVAPIGYSSTARALAIQADGKILVGGDSSPSSYQSRAAIARFLPDGQLDLAFGTNGVVAAYYDSVVALAVQPDGRILAGELSMNFALERFNADGTLDASFGSGGRFALTRALGSSFEGLTAMALQPDGRIVLVGAADNYAVDSLVARVTANGALDTTFGNGTGRVTVSMSTANEYPRAVLLQPDGGIVVGGQAEGQLYLLRLLDDGTADNTFGFAGRVLADAGANDAVRALARQPDGRIVAVGDAATTANTGYPLPSLVALRFNVDGTVDSSYGIAGRFSLPSTGMGDEAAAAVMLPDGRVLLGATRGLPVTYTIGYPEMALLRLTANGTLDGSFAQGGIATLPDVRFSGTTEAVGFAPRPDGRIRMGASSEYGCAIAGLLADGTRDPTFGIDGRAWYGANMRCRTMLGLPDGRMLLAGSGKPPNEYWGKFTVMRVLPDGAIDPSFGNLGTASIYRDFTRDHEVEALAVQPDGKIVAAGVMQDLCCSGGSFAVARLLPDGQADPAFGVGGMVITTFPNGLYAQAVGVAVQPDGAIVVGGWQGNGGQVTFVLVRYLANGTLDPAFGVGGVVANLVNGAPTSLALQPDGKILMYGGAPPPAGGVRVPTIARFLANGLLDPQFATGGVAQFTGLNGDFPGGPMMLHDGTIVIASDSFLSGPEHSVVLMRLTSGGILDNSFGSLGKVIFNGGMRAPHPTALGLQEDSRILVAAKVRYGAALMRFMNPDARPNSFAFPAVAEQPRGAWTVSAPMTVTGINMATPISISGGEYSIGCTGIFTSAPGTVSGGETICTRVMTGAGAAAATSATLTIGGVSAAFTATTDIDLAASPSTLELGAQSMRTTTPPSSIVATNNGSAPLAITGIVANGAFAATTTTCAAPLAPGASCTVDVTFTPTVAGRTTGTIALQTAQGTRTVSVAGTGERSLATHYYRSILRRAPDVSGKAFWDAEAARLAASGANLNEAWFAMASAFYFSPEYRALGRGDADFVTDLYRTFFNRAPDGSGLGFWTEQLAQGLPREVALASFMFSPEFSAFTATIFGSATVRAEVNVVTDFYRGFLARLPDSGGLAYWVQRFRTAQCSGATAVYAAVEDISRQFADGAEFAGRGRDNSQFVGDLYNAFLRRGGDLGGVRFWIDSLGNGAHTRESERRNFIGAPEFQQRVGRLLAEGCQ